MARQPMDKQILWVVLIAGIFWGGIWQHEMLVTWLKEARVPQLLHKLGIYTPLDK